MKKILRSLLHENFPEELRYKIALLAKRRDIINEEKQEELFKILREFNIKDITPLGSGTNRYAFKMNGFVIKVATDADGVIDNMKEFKMAKRLYPHVTKIYEVSANGTLLVAEYIQPFGSYGEFYSYADRIREILKEFSSVYLIGDVGITAKNYVNWGLRVGSDDPVCLDFAYVYDVKSELFLCHKCRNNSMLVPDKDFVKLICPAPGCGASYEFSDIRRRIGNDLHKHEIGDLSLEGYLMDGSNIETELNPERSNYLRVEEPEEVEEDVEEEIPLDNFELEHEIGYYLNSNNKKEEKEMSLDTKGMKPINIEAVAVEVEEEDVAFSGKMDDDVNVVKAFIVDDEEEQEDEVLQKPEVDTEEAEDDEFYATSPAILQYFGRKNRNGRIYEPAVGQMTLENFVGEADNEESETESSEPEEAAEPEEAEETVEAEEAEETVEAEEVEEPGDADEDPEEAEEETEATVEAEPEVEEEDSQTRRFKEHAHEVVSKLANMVGQYMTDHDVYEKFASQIQQKKFYKADFAKMVSTSIYKTIVTFCDFARIELPNNDGNGTHTGYAAPADMDNEAYARTIGFLKEFMEASYKTSSIEEVQDKGCWESTGLYGVQREAIPQLRNELSKRIKMSTGSINQLVDIIDNLIFIPQVVEDVDVVAEAIAEAEAEGLNYDLKAQLDEQVKRELAEEAKEAEKEENSAKRDFQIWKDDVKEPTQSLDEMFPGMKMEADIESDPTQEETVERAEDVAFSGAIESDEEDDEECIKTYIEYIYDGDRDVVKFHTADAFGEVIIPFYMDVNEEAKEFPSMVDDRNGIWDFLTHFAPLKMIKTTDPDKWIECNEVYTPGEETTRCVILDETEQGDFIIGIYIIDAIYFLDEDGGRTAVDDINVIKNINNIILNSVATNYISHLKRTLQYSEELLIPEEVALQWVTDEDDEEDDAPLSEAEEAAVSVMMNLAKQQPDESQSEDESMVLQPIHRPTKAEN